ncbi:MAG: hypothetical protein E7367_05180 [Clostridiales bacterium]|nr:hypothetical protein [Clostridiales bacterium]
MKKFLIIVVALLLLVLGLDALYYRAGVYIDFAPEAAVTAEFTVQDGQIGKLADDGTVQPFEIKAVNLTSAKPGAWLNDFAVDEKTYLRWLSQIQAMGANTVRLYTVLSDDFYNAFYRFNQDRKQPLYLLQGATVDDYVLNSRYDAYHDEFYETFYKHVKTAIEVIHGDRKIERNELKNMGSGTYTKDVSPWVLGYIWGVDWDDVTIAYANDKYSDQDGYNAYRGKYLYTAENATPFETMLTQVGDRAIAYESARYKQQRIFAFSNSAETDPFKYPAAVESMFQKCSFLDVENILPTERVVAGQFAAYNVQPYYPDYLRYFEDDDWEEMGIGDKALYATASGGVNTYKAYLQRLNNYHTMPVVISGIGFSSSRGVARAEENTSRKLGGMSEREQGEAIVSCYADALATGCVGNCLSVWQDEWYKNTWNTAHGVDAERSPFWSDAQSGEQGFGFLAFDTGKKESVCYVDGALGEWTANDVVKSYANGDSLSVKYDEKYVYFMAQKQGFNVDRDVLYIPIDTTQKSGGNYCDNYALKFDRAADFVIEVNGKTGSRVLVQEYYELLRAKYSLQVYGFNSYLKGNMPDRDSSSFKTIQMMLQSTGTASGVGGTVQLAPVYETGLLRYGNGNPAAEQYDSLADFMAGDGFVEIRLPWQMLNFYDPSTMKIYDDYYAHYGVVGTAIQKMYVGLAAKGATERIQLGEKLLVGWDNNVSYHERLKASYYVVQKAWTE